MHGAVRIAKAWSAPAARERAERHVADCAMLVDAGKAAELMPHLDMAAAVLVLDPDGTPIAEHYIGEYVAALAELHAEAKAAGYTPPPELARDE